jgi:hypothetical protein
MSTSTPPQPTVHSATPTPPDGDPRSQANIERRQALKIAERDELGRLLPGSVLQNAGHPPGPLITTLARAHTAQAISTLVEIMGDPKAPQAARATCAQALLDRGYGKAPIQIDLSVKAKFDDFLREVGASVKARKERERIAALAVTDVVANEVSMAATDDHEQGVDENDCASVD